MNHLFSSQLLTALALSLTGACMTAPRSSDARADLRADSQAALTRAKGNDPTLNGLLEDAYGTAVFPNVGKGAVGVGGAYGKGVLFQGERIVGYCDLSQASVGLQLGGQRYTEIICFRDQQSFERFKSGSLQLDAQASAVALEAGAGANAKSTQGISVFTMNEAGLMFEAAVGGQKFTYESL